mgnify:CR=1 FL=1
MRLCSMKKSLVLFVLVPLLFAGCRLRNYMVPMIVKGELKKIETQKAHRSVIIARGVRGATNEEIHGTVDFSPIDHRRWDFQSPERATQVNLFVSMDSWVLLDHALQKAEKVIGLPSFDPDTYMEFRKEAVRNAMEQNVIYVEDAPDEPDKYWVLKTEPKENSFWPYQSVSYILKETKHNVRAMEKDLEGNVVNEFLTEEKKFDVSYPAEHFEAEIPEDYVIMRYDLNHLTPVKDLPGGVPSDIPSEHTGLSLSRAVITDASRIFDYTERQRVFFYADSEAIGDEILRSPLSRELPLNEVNAYFNYAGIYTTLRWREAGRDHLIFTDLGPEVALMYAKKVSSRIALENLSTAKEDRENGIKG